MTDPNQSQKNKIEEIRKHLEKMITDGHEVKSFVVLAITQDKNHSFIHGNMYEINGLLDYTKRVHWLNMCKQHNI